MSGRVENRRESRKEKHKTKILVKYGLCKCPPFQRSCRKVPPLLFFPCMNLSSLFLIQELSQGCSPNACKLTKASGEDWEWEKALDLKCSSLFGWQSILPTPKKMSFCSFTNTVYVETLIQTGQPRSGCWGAISSFCL